MIPIYRRLFNALGITVICTILLVAMIVFQTVQNNNLDDQNDSLRIINAQLNKSLNEQVGAASLCEKIRREEDIKLHAILATISEGRQLDYNLKIAEQEYAKKIASINCIDIDTCMKLLCEELTQAGFKTDCKTGLPQ